ncbi:WW domain-binding protein 1-like isoform X2 [Hemiscyllium ocellatum]|uniref:WW domain-binding protein 1-like isoform X2 n=1 Tax=Hemiscyllium ocellatum TaxID=170820 RepID=UPI00296767CC|nr:WW domain-binding protein 1-like isoform X2 [Hemiscyllium ocellatum]
MAEGSLGCGGSGLTTQNGRQLHPAGGVVGPLASRPRAFSKQRDGGQREPGPAGGALHPAGFWLLWTLLIIFSCCCAYRHRRSKLRIQQQQRQQEINLIAYHGACHYPGSGLDQRLLASFKLPAYEEVSAQPRTPPPSYTSIQCPGVRTELSSSLSSNNITSSHHTPIAHSTDFEPGPPVPSSHQSTEDVNIAVSQASPCCLGLEEDEEEDEDETHSRHRRLTGDSGIEVCHCLVHADGSEDCEESSNYQHDQMVSVELHTAPLQPANYASPCSCLLPQETSTHILPV